ncbi:L,D-transpeptidase [Coxiella burnetii]|uniref:Enhanced entry protein n=1 Tax=Coxiella burnetii (strain RSA 493 / Nine Mile phase I) TaxID=227377 RepID=Q83F95_COXBU|nr:L,D-transpeptidase [Coxiella burnetii]NP_819106.1 enhanced entry protein [Coxiella burnetii RSA 493]AAO89620.1 enhanced entry protein [Coxiella burnetii RSA 493]ARI64979.1 L,D-transpeptidase [Coxiella burnetii]ARK26484.1 L,D-transpeptidase [Coxiella burnetii]MCF2093121.1 L,D-transpeptidase [Coxiella burnetii]MCF2095212.1 L,D-transpeptidase [Coxiella burnetii]
MVRGLKFRKIKGLISISMLVLLALTNSAAYGQTSPHHPDVNYEESRYYGAHLCAYSEFTCIAVKPGDTWTKLFPNKREREIVKRLNRTNMALSNRHWIVVPTELTEVEYLDLSPFPPNIHPTHQKLLVVNLGLHAFAAYDEKGQLVHWGPVSGGQEWCSDVGRKCNTVVGNFRIVRLGGPECVSNKFPVETEGGAPMPYCMFYFRGYALHGSTLPGYHASHGCIRLFHDDAKWLNKHFLNVGTQIIVTR